MYKLKYLLKNANDTHVEINGKWVPARPEPFYGLYGLKCRISDAYKVLTGKADAFTWYEEGNKNEK